MRSMPIRHLQPRRSSTQKSIISRPNRRSVFFLPAYCATWPCRRYLNSPWENFCCAACWRRRIRWRCRGKSPPAGAAINYLPSPAKAFKPPPGTVLGGPGPKPRRFSAPFKLSPKSAIVCGCAGAPAKTMKRCSPTAATAAASRSRGTTTSWSTSLVAPTGWPPPPRQHGKI